MEQEKYKVGDIVVVHSTYGFGYGRTFVKRLTKTQAILDSGVKLKIDIIESSTEIGVKTWDANLYQKQTPELKVIVDKYFLVKKVKTAISKLSIAGTLDNLADDELNNILSTLSKY